MMLERGPWENRFRGHRWNCLSLMGPMWVGTKGAPSSTVGVACCRRVPPVATFETKMIDAELTWLDSPVRIL